MIRSGFTMIELIFVIVVLGILATVALPKFAGVSEQAEVANCKTAIGSINRTIAPVLWLKSLNEGRGGVVDANDTAAITDSYMSGYSVLKCGTISTLGINATDGEFGRVAMQSNGNESSAPIWIFFPKN